MPRPTTATDAWATYDRVTGAAARVARMQERASRGPGFYAHQALTEQQDQLRRVARQGITEAASVARQAAQGTTARTSLAAAEAFRTSGVGARAISHDWLIKRPSASLGLTEAASVARQAVRGTTPRTGLAAAEAFRIRGVSTQLTSRDWLTGRENGSVALGLLASGAGSPVQRGQEKLLRQTLDRARAQVRMSGAAWPSSFALSLGKSQRFELQRVGRELQAARSLAPSSQLHSQLGALHKQVIAALEADRTTHRAAARLASLPGDTVRALAPWPSGFGAYQPSVLDQASRHALHTYISPLDLRVGVGVRTPWQDLPFSVIERNRRVMQRSQAELYRAARDAFRQGVWTPDLPTDAPAPAPEESETLAAVAVAILSVETAKRFSSAQEHGKLLISQAGDLLQEVGRTVEHGAEVAREQAQEAGWALYARRELMPLLNFEEKVALRDKERVFVVALTSALSASAAATLWPSPTTYLSWIGAHAAAWATLRSLYCHLGVLAVRHEREELVPEWHRS